MPETLREKAKNHPHVVNRVLALGLIASLLVIIALTVFVQQQQYQANQAATQIALSNAALERSNAVNRSIALALQAEQLAASGENALALALALEATRIENPPSEAESALRKLLGQPGIRRIVPLPENVPNTAGRLMDATFAISPDASYVIYSDGAQFYRLFTLTGRVVPLFQSDSPTIVINPRGYFFVRGSDGVCLQYDRDGNIVKIRSASYSYVYIDWLCGAQFSPDGRYAYVEENKIGQLDKSAVYDTTTWEQILVWNTIYGRVIFTPDSKVLLTLDPWSPGGDGPDMGRRITLWRLEDPTLLTWEHTAEENPVALIGLKEWVYQDDQGQQSGVIFIRTRNGTDQIGTGRAFSFVRSLPYLASPTSLMDIDSTRASLDGRFFAGHIASDEERLLIYDTGTEIETNILPGGMWNAFTPDGKTLWTGPVQGNLIAIDLSTARDHSTDTMTLPELVAYAEKHRYIPEFTCAQREQYRIEPPCANTDIQGTETPDA